MRNFLASLSVGLLLLAAASAVPAKATTLHLVGDGDVYDLDGYLTIAGVPNIAGRYDILSAAITVTGPVSGLATLVPNPNQPFQSIYPTPGGYWTFDNNFLNTATPFNIDGLLLQWGGLIGNLYMIANQAYFSTTTPGGLFIPGDPMQVSVTQTPLPGALVLFGSALVGVTLLGRRRQKRLSGAAA